MRKVLFISLGCDKNLADSEEMLGMLVTHGYEITNDETEANGAHLFMMQKKKVLQIFWRWHAIKRKVS